MILLALLNAIALTFWLYALLELRKRCKSLVRQRAEIREDSRETMNEMIDDRGLLNGAG